MLSCIEKYVNYQDDEDVIKAQYDQTRLDLTSGATPPRRYQIILDAWRDATSTNPAHPRRVAQRHPNVTRRIQQCLSKLAYGLTPLRLTKIMVSETRSG